MHSRISVAILGVASKCNHKTIASFKIFGFVIKKEGREGPFTGIGWKSSLFPSLCPGERTHSGPAHQMTHCHRTYTTHPGPAAVTWWLTAINSTHCFIHIEAHFIHTEALSSSQQYKEVQNNIKRFCLEAGKEASNRLTGIYKARIIMYVCLTNQGLYRKQI